MGPARTCGRAVPSGAGPGAVGGGPRQNVGLSGGPRQNVGLTGGAQAERGADGGAQAERGSVGGGPGRTWVCRGGPGRTWVCRGGPGLTESGVPRQNVGTEGSRRGALLPWVCFTEQGGRMISCQGGGVRRVCLLLIYFNMGPGRVTEPSPSP